MRCQPIPINPNLDAAANHDSEVSGRATRRRFTAAQKARILEEYERGSAIERAALCRRARIYSSLISNWRRQLADGRPLAEKRGRKPDPQAAEITRLRKKEADLEQRLAKAEQVIDVQGQVYALLRSVAGKSADQSGLATVEQAVKDLALVVGEREACVQIGYPRSVPAMFANSTRYHRKLTMLPKGIAVTETSNDARIVEIIRAHAREINGFVKDGMSAMMHNMMQ